MANEKTLHHAHKNRKVRQEALREQMAEQCRLQHIIDLLRKVEESESTLEVQKYKASLDIRLKLLGKYLPDLKAMEITGEGGERLIETVTLNVIKPAK